jgi:hypothetical protein
MYFFPPEHPSARHTSVDLSNTTRLDVDRDWPLLRKAMATELVLEAGDLL